MTRILLVLALVLAAAQQEQYPGQAQHGQPSEGWFCNHQTPDLQTPPDHVCSCVRMCEIDADGKEDVPESPQCSSYCWKSHCQCKPIPCGS